MDASIEAAVAARFPRPSAPARQRASAPAPEYRWSDYHVKRALDNVLAPLPDGHRLPAGIDLALSSTRRWDAFVAAVEYEHRTGVALPATPNWLAQYGPRIRRQANARVPHQAHSTGAVEAVNDWLAAKLSRRARHLGNRQRTIKLLDLLTVGYNHGADERTFAVDIRKYLEGHHGRTQLQQRAFDDIKKTPSLYT